MPFFAVERGQRIAVVLVVFYTMLALWCAAGYAFVRVDFIAKALTKYGRYIIPGALMGLGLYIIWTSGCFSVLTQ